MDPLTISALILALTVLLVTADMVPKTLAALVGALMMVIYDIVKYSEVGSLINMKPLITIMGMMIMIEVIKKSGIFHFVGIKVIKLTKGKIKPIFISLAFLSMILAIFLNNSTAIMISVALTITLCRSMNINPIPFIISQIVATQIGGMVFLTSSTPAILIGEASGYTFAKFFILTFPLSLILVSITVLYYLRHFKYYFSEKEDFNVENLNEWSVVHDKRFFINSWVILGLTIFLFLMHGSFGLSIDLIAMGVAIISLLISKSDPDEVLKNVNWGALFFIVGFFIVVGGAGKTGLLGLLTDKVTELSNGNTFNIFGLVVLLSSFFSFFINDIPAAMILIPVIEELGMFLSSNVIWIGALASLSVGGILTPIGANSCLIGLKIAKKEGYDMTFQDHFKRVSGLVLILLLAVFAYSIVINWLF